jgi:hypothetical protein
MANGSISCYNSFIIPRQYTSSCYREQTTGANSPKPLQAYLAEFEYTFYFRRREHKRQSCLVVSVGGGPSLPCIHLILIMCIYFYTNNINNNITKIRHITFVVLILSILMIILMVCIIFQSLMIFTIRITIIISTMCIYTHIYLYYDHPFALSLLRIHSSVSHKNYPSFTIQYINHCLLF